jgi:hypothetical protein
MLVGTPISAGGSSPFAHEAKNLPIVSLKAPQAASPGEEKTVMALVTFAMRFPRERQA